MIEYFPAEQRHHVDHGWLQSHFSFSFAEYYDPANMSFGALRVLNDDIIAPQKGFGMHPHRDMEIITFVLKGELEHRDDLGNAEIMRPGIVQKMTAGTGIRHSEINPNAYLPVELLQIWIQPNVLHLEPGYEMVSYRDHQIKNKLHPVISSKHKIGEGHIHQDATIFLTHLEKMYTITYPIPVKRKGFLFVIDGEISVNESHTLRRRDSVRISDEANIIITASTTANVLFIELP